MDGPRGQRLAEASLLDAEFIGYRLRDVQRVHDQRLSIVARGQGAWHQAGHGRERVARHAVWKSRGTLDESWLERHARRERAPRDVDAGPHGLPDEVRALRQQRAEPHAPAR